MKALGGILLLFVTCCYRAQVPEKDLLITIREGGDFCQAPCGVKGINLTADECQDLKDFVPMYLDVLGSNVDIDRDLACEYLRGQEIVVTEANDRGNFQLRDFLVNGVTDCANHITFIGLPPGKPNSALAHELTHTVDCMHRGLQQSHDHLGWDQVGYCRAIHNVSTLKDVCP